MKLRAGRELTERGGYGVLRQLRSMQSGPGVWWSERGNSYVACRRDDGSLVAVSINGIGEIRWTVETWNRDAESLAAVAYFFEGV